MLSMTYHHHRSERRHRKHSGDEHQREPKLHLLRDGRVVDNQ